MKTAWTLAMLMLFSAAVDAQEAPAVTVSQAAGARVVEATLPGWVLGVAATGDGHRLAILAASEAGVARTLWLLDLQAEPELEVSVTNLPTASHVIVDLPSGTLAVGEPGKVHVLGAGGEGPPELALEAPHLNLSFLEHHGMLTAAGIFQPLVGRLRVFQLGESTTWTVADEIELPLDVRRERRGLRLASPPVTVFDRGDRPPLVLAGPLARGSTRLLTTWIDAETRNCDDEACEQRRQRWCRLPSPEAVTESYYVDVDGRATLVVATVAADQVGVFERKKLRVFPLWSDRTRAGAAATLAAETTSRRWQEVAVEVLDLSGDGRDDLVVLQRDGLGGKSVVVEAYTGTGNGGFYRTSRKSEVTAPDAVWRYGGDFDGDGHPDLAAWTEDRLLVFAGIDHKRRVVEKKPRWSFDTPQSLGESSFVLLDGATDEDVLEGVERIGGLELVDLDGDDRPEIALWSSTAGRTELRIVSALR